MPIAPRTQKRFVQSVFVVCIFASAHAQDALDCSKWTLASYRVGMTKDEAFAVRGGKWKKHGAELRSEPEEYAKAKAEFGPDGILTDVRTQSGYATASVKLGLIQRLGQPTQEGMPGQIISAPFIGSIRVFGTRWESRECDMVIQLNDIQSTTTEGIAWDDHSVRLWRLSGPDPMGQPMQSHE